MIDEKDIERLKDIFVPRSECNNTQDEIDNKINKNLIKIAVIENDIKSIKWLQYAICGGILTVVIKIFLGG